MLGKERREVGKGEKAVEDRRLKERRNVKTRTEYTRLEERRSGVRKV